MKAATFGLAAILAAGSAGTCWAQDLKATQKFTDTEIGFEAGSAYSNLTLTITGPNGLQATAASKTGAPAIDLRQLGKLDDGTYHYQLTASTEEKVPVRNSLDNGRGSRTAATQKGVATSGQFQVKGGAIIKADPAAREETGRKP